MKHYSQEYYLQTLNTENKEEKKRKTKDELKKELISSLVEDDVLGNKEMNEREKGINKFEDAITVVREYETIIIISL